MALVTISDFKAGKLPKVGILEVKVHKQIGEAKYIIADKTDSIELSSILEGNPPKKFYLQPGQFIRIIKPLSTSIGIKLSTFQPTPIAPFEVLPFEEILEASSLQSQGNDSKKVEDLKTFIDFNNLAAKSNIGKLVSKVVYISPKKAAKYSACRTVGLKDVTGKKSHVTLFGKLAEAVETEKVYEFQNLKVQNYKSQTDEFHRLGSTSTTTIQEASSNVATLFQTVLLGDGLIEGHILGHERLFCYKSCPTCMKKCDDVACCKSCQGPINSLESICDFNVTLQVMDEIDDDEVKLVLCFRKAITQEIKMEEQQVRTFLGNLIGQRCRIEYEFDKSKKDVLIALKITIQNKRARTDGQK